MTMNHIAEDLKRRSPVIAKFNRGIATKFGDTAIFGSADRGVSRS